MPNFTYPLVLDGGMGTMLQQAGLAAGELPEIWNIARPDEIIQIHKAYLEARARVITANTFGANRLKYPAGGDYELKEIIGAAVACARAAAQEYPGSRVALDIGPTGKLLEPMGPLSFEDAVSIYREIATIGAAAGADVLFIETMTDLLELRAAVLGCKEGAAGLPIFASFTLEETGRMLTGATPACAAMMLESLGVAAVGVNCGAGPERARRALPELLANCSLPIIVQPNAGMPEVRHGQTVFPLAPAEFARKTAELCAMGADILGGCCGTTPGHIRALAEQINKLPARNQRPACKKPGICSASQVVRFGDFPVLIGERINPTGKPNFQKQLRAQNWDYILDEAIAQAEAGAHVLDVNLGLPGIDERAAMLEAVTRLQQATPLPLQIDSASPAVLEAALRRYQGRALVNSVNGKAENMRAVFPLVQKYGGMAVALLLDETGIPATVAGRLAIAEKIYATAAEYGIGKDDILIDALTMTVSAEPTGAQTTLETLAQIHAMGGRTVLGVSNISFGLPQRELINASFFTLALHRGLSAAIINPKSAAMMGAYRSFNLLNCNDDNAESYVQFASTMQVAQTKQHVIPTEPPATFGSQLATAILLGREKLAQQLAKEELNGAPPLEIIQQSVIPALDEVGKQFAKGTLFLPQLLRSAAAAKAALHVLQAEIKRLGSEEPPRGTIVLATVHGDIHDIGKNIVKTLLETYHFTVIDLGKDVPPQTVCDAVLEYRAKVCGLSALMTTTVPAMEATIQLLRAQAPDCRVMVGGAVLTEAFAMEIGADAYCKDAMAGVRAAEKALDIRH